jgi:MFS transporter, YNFM family, putative membrane transport protein
VNFVLVRPPLSLGPMELGFVYFVFLPSIVTTLWAGRAVHRYGTGPGEPSTALSRSFGCG